MQSALKTLIFVVCLAMLSLTAMAHVSFMKTGLKTFTGKQYSFNGQLVDHFNPQDKRTFSQRYWVGDEFYVPSTSSPIIFYICGEATCKGFPGTTSFPYQLAQKTGALMVGLEHRYYGLSQPLGKDSMTTEGLKYLTVENGLEDLAYFMQWFKVNYKYRISEQQPWITIGGSYPGALSAWFRSKYPHLTVGAWASSAVVNAVLDFTDFDNQIFLALSKSGPACPKMAQNLTAYFEYQLYNTSSSVQKKFREKFGAEGQKLSNDELLWYIADSFVLQVQYGKRTELCNFLLANYSSYEELVDKTIKFFLEAQTVKPYGSYFVSNSTFEAEMEDQIGRQWNYQVCSQVGWFQTPAKDSTHAVRSQRITLDFYKKFCKEAYGKALWPDVEKFNLDFGGVNLQATNVINTNGCEDPWQWAAKNSTNGSFQNIYIDCNDCGHCVDFHGDAAGDSDALKQAHKQIQDLVLSYFGKKSTREMIYA